MTQIIVLHYDDYLFELNIFYMNILINILTTILWNNMNNEIRIYVDMGRAVRPLIILKNGESPIFTNKYNNWFVMFLNIRDYYNYRSRNLSFYKKIIWIFNTEDILEISRFIFDCIFILKINDKIELYGNYEYHHITILIINFYYVYINLYYIITFMNLCFNIIYYKINNTLYNPIYNYYCNINNDDCPICLDNNSNKWIILNICKHIFHEKCIITWILTPNGNKCPVCRQNIH